MAISKKQFDFAVRGRVNAIASSGSLALSNLQVVIEGFALEGVEYDLTTPATAGTGDEAVSYPTVVADNASVNTATIAATAAAIKAAIGALKGIS